MLTAQFIVFFRNVEIARGWLTLNRNGQPKATQITCYVNRVYGQRARGFYWEYA